MVREHGGDGEIVVPPTIHALLQARIDSLDGDVRVVMERGSVEGEVFHRGAVAALSPALVRGGVEAHLATLVRKELIRSTPSTFPRTRASASAISSSAMRRTSRCRRRRERSCTSSSPTGSRRTSWSRGTRSSGTTSSRRIATARSWIGAIAALARLAARASDASRRRPERVHSIAATSTPGGRSSARVRPAPERRRARLALAPDSPAHCSRPAEATRHWELLGAVDRRCRPADSCTRARDAVVLGRRRARADQAEREAWRDEALEIFEQADDHYGIALYWWCVAIRCLVPPSGRGRRRKRCERALAHLERSGDRGTRLLANPRGRLLSALSSRADAGRRRNRTGRGGP